jgi:ribosomal protein S18 acetylase RimI-like enzyme
MVIRRVELKDAPILATLSASTFFDTFNGTCTEEDMDTLIQSYFNIPQVEKELKDENDFYFFAEINNVPVGYVRFKEEYQDFPMMKKWKELELKRIYVKEEFHGKGIAQQLMDFVIQFCIDNKYEVVWLGVWEHNIKAQKFYLKYGFENSGHTHNFPIGNTPQTDIWFWKFL